VEYGSYSMRESVGLSRGMRLAETDVGLTLQQEPFPTKFKCRLLPCSAREIPLEGGRSFRTSLPFVIMQATEEIGKTAMENNVVVQSESNDTKRGPQLE
jgi:hypothetical protein